MTATSTEIVIWITLGGFIGIAMMAIGLAWQELRKRRTSKRPAFDRERELRRVAADLYALSARMDKLVTPEAAEAAEAAAPAPAPDRARATA